MWWASTARPSAGRRRHASEARLREHLRDFARCHPRLGWRKAHAAVLVEAKATATPSASLLAGATRVSRHLADSFAATDMICVYGGDTAQQRLDGQLIPWRRLHHPDTGRRLLA